MGYTSYKMDPKYRVSIQPAWRPVAGEVLYLMSSMAYEMPVIKVLSQEAFEKRVNTVKEGDFSPGKKIELLGRLSMNCRPATVNDQGKLLVPKELSEQVGITAEAEVVLAGRGMHFEVWSKTNHARVVEIEKPTEAEYDLGIF